MDYRLVVIGTSLGGLHALKVLLAALPEKFPIPIAIVQHREKDNDEDLEGYLQESSALHITEAGDKEEFMPGYAYMAPPDYHLLIESGFFALSTEAPVHYSRPSIDVLFESAADIYRDKVIGIILTGAGRDGSAGLKSIKERGGLALVQEPVTSECSAMPENAIKATTVDYILPLESIVPFLIDLYGKISRRV